MSTKHKATTKKLGSGFSAGRCCLDIGLEPMNFACVCLATSALLFACTFFRSGKSSIMKVVFHKMSPNETLFLESTNKIVKEDVTNSSFVQFSIWDFPGQIDFVDAGSFDSEKVLFIIIIVIYNITYIT
jgi:hypothetical protein